MTFDDFLQLYGARQVYDPDTGTTSIYTTNGAGNISRVHGDALTNLQDAYSQMSAPDSRGNLAYGTAGPGSFTFDRPIGRQGFDLNGGQYSQMGYGYDDLAADPKYADFIKQSGVTPQDFSYDPTYGYVQNVNDRTNALNTKLGNYITQQNQGGLADRITSMMPIILGTIGATAGIGGAFAGAGGAAEVGGGLGVGAGDIGAGGVIAGEGGSGALIGGATGDALAGAGEFALAPTGAGLGGIGTSGLGLSVPGTAGLGGEFTLGGLGGGAGLAATTAAGVPLSALEMGAGGIGAGTAALGGAVTGAGGDGASSIFSRLVSPASSIARILNGTGTTEDFVNAGLSVAGPLATLGAGALGANAAGKASDAEIAASNAAIAEQRRQFDLTRSDNAPFLSTGTAANTRLRQLMGLDPSYTGADSGQLTRKFTSADLNADPVYQSGLQFGLDQGTKGINARAIAGGNYNSGATLKALTQYGNDYASTKGGDAYNRYVTDQGNEYNRLAGVSGTGQTAVNTVANAGQASTNAISGALTDQGNARAAGIVGGANAWGSAAQGINSSLNNYSSNQILQQLLASRSPSSLFTG
jgi:hypothetical protein